MLGLQVAELNGKGMLVGVVRGCIKCVEAGVGTGHARVGCILGLRVSPKYRLVASVIPADNRFVHALIPSER